MDSFPRPLFIPDRNARWKGKHLLASAFLALSAVSVFAQGIVLPATDSIPWRTPWTRGAERFQREWQICGPVAAEQVAALSSRGADPGAGVEWISHRAWGDEIDVGSLVPPTSDRIALARTRVARAEAGAATLLIGADGSLEVFVNGVSVHQRSRPLPFAPDQTTVPVDLEAGDNAIVLRLENGFGALRTTLRVVAPGAIVPPLDEIRPSILGDENGELTIRTHFEKSPALSPVKVEVIVPGGDVIAGAEVVRGDEIRFRFADWAHGPFEVRCTTRNAWGDIRAAHLAWFNGDPEKAVAELRAFATTEPVGPQGDHVRMLADMAENRLAGVKRSDHTESRRLLNSPLFEYRELLEERAGRTGGVRPWGFIRIAYTDEVDGSTQFCRTYLPPNYDPSRRWPVVAFLHGYNPENPPYINWWDTDERHRPQADHHGVIYIEPHGRGNTGFVGIGEQDVLRALAEVEQRLSVDEDRISLTGESMGGGGTWLIASRSPDVFAAAAPVYGGWDERLLSASEGGLAGIEAANDLEHFDHEARASFVSAENLMHVPLYVHHGDSDPAVDVNMSRYAVRLLERWGYDVRYQEREGLGHENLGVRETIVEWLKEHRRVTAPRSVRLRAPDLAAADAYWLRVEAAAHPNTLIEVDAEFMRPGVLRLDTQNVTAVTVAPPEELRDGAKLRVTWNGVDLIQELLDGQTRLGTPPAPAGTLAKRRGLEGLIADFIRTPFLIVIGSTSEDEAMRRVCREKADAFVAEWEDWQKHRPRVCYDHELTPEDAATYSLLLIGGPEANSATHKFAPDLPLLVEANRITVDGRSWEVDDAVVQMIYPSPAALDRYVLAVAGTTADGLAIWSPRLSEDKFLFGTIQRDWTIQEAGNGSASGEDSAYVVPMASGVFDPSWRRDDRWVVENRP